MVNVDQTFPVARQCLMNCLKRPNLMCNHGKMILLQLMKCGCITQDLSISKENEDANQVETIGNHYIN